MRGHRLNALIVCRNPRPQPVWANLYSQLDQGAQLFNFGLGSRDEKCTLTVPKSNFGGAFILNSGNALSLGELANKDGYGAFDKSNYDEMTVELRCGRRELSRIFAECQGGVVIKIDVEGFEQTILREVAAALPTQMPFGIVFENWSRSFDARTIAEQIFQRPVKTFKIASSVESQSGSLKKLWELLVHGRKYRLNESPADWVGTIAYADESIKLS